ncbi:MAG: hypothetical protein IJ668_06650 [Selenomonadaceae bacterium]|nr:hypothetical protein [Selenomonadaceae bacterium]
MGSRASFKSAGGGDFTFVENGQTYRTIGGFDNLRVLIKEKGSVKAPEFSHTENRIYAVVQKGVLKHLVYYDEKHRQAVSIDLTHSHHGVQPHKHIYLDHSDKGIPISAEEQRLVDRVKKEFNLK